MEFKQGQIVVVDRTNMVQYIKDLREFGNMEFHAKMTEILNSNKSYVVKKDSVRIGQGFMSSSAIVSGSSTTRINGCDTRGSLPTTLLMLAPLFEKELK